MNKTNPYQSFLLNLILLILVGTLGYLIGISRNPNIMLQPVDYSGKLALISQQQVELEKQILEQQKLLLATGDILVELDKLAASQGTFLAKLEQLEKTLQQAKPEQVTVQADAIKASVESTWLPYIVQRGDTIWAIASWSKGEKNILEQVDIIQQYNNISRPESLLPGEKLLIPIY